MLASVYSYRVMVKIVSSCCVRGSRVLSNPVTNIDGTCHIKAQEVIRRICNTYVLISHEVVFNSLVNRHMHACMLILLFQTKEILRNQVCHP